MATPGKIEAVNAGNEGWEQYIILKSYVEREQIAGMVLRSQVTLETCLPVQGKPSS